MIQRIQSLYLFFYIIIKSHLLYKSLKNLSSLHLFVDNFDLFPLALVLQITTSLLVLFNFKNRKTQIKILYFLTTIQLIILTLILILAYEVDKPLSFLRDYQTLLYFFGLILLLFSLKGIKKDQNLINSIDRIR